MLFSVKCVFICCLLFFLSDLGSKAVSGSVASGEVNGGTLVTNGAEDEDDLEEGEKTETPGSAGVKARQEAAKQDGKPFQKI